MKNYEKIGLICNEIQNLKNLVNSDILNVNVSNRIITKFEKGLVFVLKHKSLKDLESSYLIFYSILNELRLLFFKIKGNTIEFLTLNQLKVVIDNYEIKSVLFNNTEIVIFKKINYSTKNINSFRSKSDNFLFQTYIIESKILKEIDQIIFSYLTNFRNKLDLVHGKTRSILEYPIPLSKKYDPKYVNYILNYILFLLQTLQKFISKSEVEFKFNIRPMKYEDTFINGIIQDKLTIKKNEENEHLFFLIDVFNSGGFKQLLKMEVSKENFEVYNVGETIKAFINFSVYDNKINNIKGWKIQKIITENDMQYPI